MFHADTMIMHGSPEQFIFYRWNIEGKIIHLEKLGHSVLYDAAELHISGDSISMTLVERNGLFLGINDVNRFKRSFSMNLYRLKPDGSGFVDLDSKQFRFFRSGSGDDMGMEFIGFLSDSIAFLFGNKYDEVVVVSLLNDKIRFCKRHVIMEREEWPGTRMFFAQIKNNILFQDGEMNGENLKVCTL